MEELKTKQLIQPLDLSFAIMIENNNLKVIFNKSFFLHKEAVETIQYFMDSIKNMTVSDSLIKQVTIWFKGFLNLCKQTGLLSYEYITGFILIEGGMNE